jgi:hypothetical protein
VGGRREAVGGWRLAVGGLPVVVLAETGLEWGDVMVVRSFEELAVYQLSFELQQEIFELSKSFPRNEKYSLTDQLRRSSRSVGANIAEACENAVIQRISFQS